ncbi:transglutaminase-like domain-containing protein [Flammeovirga sp. SubArs3]|uniref:transglutaminase domain-containing protein n=1 Tax=Flammeovirga sp. SubArs3 TaxID=2995316 RepID=UPI00248C53AA|nr:transglutaminase-like domain-containing protein [Flammeovirga sp. SubArs3]
MKKLILLCLLISHVSFGQSKLVSQTIGKIDIQEDTVKSVFDWIVKNIKYDVNKLQKIKNGKSPTGKMKFYTTNERNVYLIDQVVKKKAGVCQDYSLLLDVIMKELGYESYIIKGYTKRKDGSIGGAFGHTWNAIKVNGEWKLYDPTWGAGTVENGKKFHQNYDLNWYDVAPEKMIERHMPYDPIWQLLDTPYTYENFNKNTIPTPQEPKYDYNTLIAEHLKKDDKSRMEAEVARSEELGNTINLVKEWRKLTLRNMSIHGVTSNRELLEKGKEAGSNAIEGFNFYVEARNKHFKGKKWSAVNAKAKLVEAKDNIEIAYDIFNNIDVDEPELKMKINEYIDKFKQIKQKIDEGLVYIKDMKGI